MAERVFKDDIGTIIEINLQENISAATNLKYKVKKPNGVEVDWTPTLYGTNYLRYPVIAGDLNLTGIYYIQPYMTLGGWTGRGDTVDLTVYDHFEMEVVSVSRRL
jgi:hypothetical protein